MLSNLSGFTQSDDDMTSSSAAMMAMPQMSSMQQSNPFQMGQAAWGSYDQAAMRHGSSGSGSGGGSVGDPKSPVVGNGSLR